jgi:predicted ATP-grasp superfamily ATP-dependent carboligase
MRALARGGWEVLGADDRLMPWGLRSRYARGTYHQLPPKDDPSLAERLLELVERVRPDVLIPMRGEAVHGQRSALERHTHVLLPSPEAFGTLHDKSALLSLCARLDLPAPAVLSVEGAVEQLRTGASPVVVKPCRDIGGGVGVHFVTDAARLADTYGQVEAAYGKALLTEYIPGPTRNLRAVQLLFDAQSRLVGHFVQQKLRVWPYRVGVSVGAVSTHEPWLVEQLLPIFQAVKWRGPADAELKIDPRDGKAKLLEINTRFSGALHFAIECGVNFPLLYCRAALGERLVHDLQPRYRPGTLYLTHPRWLLSLIAELREQPGAWRQLISEALLRELRGPQVRSIHESSDPGPILGRALLAVRHQLGIRAARPPR